jgi:hypothetical protein
MSSYRSVCLPSVGVSACCLCVCQLSVCLPAAIVVSSFHLCVCRPSMCLPAVLLLCTSLPYVPAFCLFLPDCLPATPVCLEMMLLQIQSFPWLRYFIAALLKHTVGEKNIAPSSNFFQHFADFLQWFIIMKSFDGRVCCGGKGVNAVGKLAISWWYCLGSNYWNYVV